MPKQIYPWSTWMNGELYILQYGTDFQKDPNEFGKSARKYARRYGKKAAVRIIGDKVCLQFFEVEDK
ncbi:MULTISPECIES: hypothetical protein [unclassified Streptomyces]|uniref:hypothetical protein n=1 Tax=unclassified Streptomyces TaxID=2593676 RepID=UPI0036DFCEAA